jgi:hydroxyacylglutathione hydrolase
MFVQQFFVKGLAHSSYLLAGSETCAIVDPQRDVDVYLQAAEDMGMTITHILQTHLHADFVSGHLDLADATGAPIYVPASADCGFEHVAVSDGSSCAIGDLALTVLETPGHTPEHISYVVVDNARGPESCAVFCGDTLFVGDVGRPDLFPGQAVDLANKLYTSLHDKLLKLPDFCEVYPAHGAGSLCGRAMGAKRTSTIGYERRYNAALQIADRQAFVESLTTNMPAAPDHFSRCSAINRAGPARIGEMPELEALKPEAFRSRAECQGAVVLDTRSYEAFGGMHVPNAYHIDAGGNFSTFAGWILPPDAEILLVASSEAQAAQAAAMLRRVGLDRVTGVLHGGMFAWAKEGYLLEYVDQVSAHDLQRMATSGQSAVLVDVRAPTEYDKHHIDGAINIPAPALRTRHAELDPDARTVLICSTGHRSSMAASLLKQQGFRDVVNVSGGMTGYTAAGFAPECPVCIVPHGPRFIGRKLN